MQSFIQDLRFATRLLLKSPGFTAIAVFTLALGIGANTAIFSLTDQILLRLLPVPEPEQLVVLRSPGPKWGSVSSDGDDAASFSYPMYKELRDRNTVFSGLLARYSTAVSVAGSEQTERASGELVSGNYFEVLGVKPAVGRVFTQEDDRTPGAHPFVVLSHGYWTRRFGADPGIVNKTLVVNAKPMVVAGVAEPGFFGVQQGQEPDLFIPMAMKQQITPQWDGLNDHKDYWLAIIGRLKPNLAREQAEAELATMYRSILEEILPLVGTRNAEDKKRFVEKKLLLEVGSQGRPNRQREAREPLLILMGMAGLVLMIACANVASLLLARGAARQREVAVRMALGCGRWRLVRQFLIDSLLLFTLGGVAGLVVASWTIKGLIVVLASGIGDPGGLSSELNLRLLAFNFALALLTGLAFGLGPALRATNLNLEGTLRQEGSSVSGSLSQVRFRKALVASQIVLTTILLVGAGLFARSLSRLSQVDLGLRPHQVVSFRLAPELNGYSSERSTTFFDKLREQLLTIPGVESVSAADMGVLTDSTASANITIQGYEHKSGEDINISLNHISPKFFATLGIALQRGRDFTDSDRMGSPKVAIINEAMARNLFPNHDPIGRRFAFGSGNAVVPDIEIVGIVKDSKHATVREKTAPFAYLPYAQKNNLGQLTLYVRSRQDLATLEPSLRETVKRLDAHLPIFELKTLEKQVDDSIFMDKLLTWLCVGFGLLAALLAALGLYGVMAYLVTLRTREIGIRMALGANRRGIAWLVLREVAILASIGLAIGLPTAIALGRVSESLLFGVKAGDPIVIAGACLLLGLIALIGGFLPARKAGGINPMVALRN